MKDSIALPTIMQCIHATSLDDAIPLTLDDDISARDNLIGSSPHLVKFDLLCLSLGLLESLVENVEQARRVLQYLSESHLCCHSGAPQS